MAIGRAVRRADRVIVPSEATARDLIERRLAPPERIVCIPEGVNPLMRRISPTPAFGERYQINRPFILTVGVLEPRKNHTILLEVLRRLRKEGHDLELIIIGRPGWRWINPRANDKYRDLWPWVRILADIPDSDLIEFYSRAELFIYPSWYEGFGLPLLEAMACGAPAISSSVSSMPEVAGDAALFADPERCGSIRGSSVAIVMRRVSPAEDGRCRDPSCTEVQLALHGRSDAGIVRGGLPSNHTRPRYAQPIRTRH